MRELINLGLSEETIKEMLEHNIEIKDLSEDDIIAKEVFLKNIGVSISQIANVISSNPYFLTDDEDISHKVIEKLEYLGFKDVNSLIESNPLILSLDAKDISKFIKEEVKNGKTFETVIEELDLDPSIFNEM